MTIKKETPFIDIFANKMTLITVSLLCLGLSGCGESDKIKEEYDRIEDQVKDEYENISDDIKSEYKQIEDKLTDNEKSTAEIIESIFLPSNFNEDLESFLDKLTPEGGKGGLYTGHFVEINDNDSDDIDIGAVYFDIGKDAASSVDGRVSYQQQRCQDNNTLATDTAFKVDNYLVGKLSGSLDTLKFLDIKYVNDLDIVTPSLLSSFVGEFDEKSIGSPWTGSFKYLDGVGGKKLSSGKDNCDVVYTVGQNANYIAYPLDYKRGELRPSIVGTGLQTRLEWSNPTQAALTLVSQINVNHAKVGNNGYVVNQVFTDSDLINDVRFTPIINSTSTNYAFVIQAFDKDNNLIGFESVVMDLPEAL